MYENLGTTRKPHDKPIFDNSLFLNLSKFVLQNSRAPPSLHVLWVSCDCYHVSDQREWRKVVQQEKNKVRGRNDPQFWQGLHSAPFCEWGLKSLAKQHFINLISVTGRCYRTKAFFLPFKPHYSADSTDCPPLRRVTEIDGEQQWRGVKEKERKGKMVPWKISRKERKRRWLSVCSGHIQHAV